MPPQSSAPLEFTTDPSGNHHHDVHLHFAAGPVISPDKRKVRRSHYPDINKASHMPPAILLRQKPPREEEVTCSGEKTEIDGVPVTSPDWNELVAVATGRVAYPGVVTGRFLDWHRRRERFLRKKNRRSISFEGWKRELSPDRIRSGAAKWAIQGRWRYKLSWDNRTLS